MGVYMIKIDIYDNTIKINGHAKPETCYQVSIAMFILANAMGDLGERVSYQGQDNTGYSELVFNITYDTKKLRDSYERDMRLWFEHFKDDVKVSRLWNS
jgi:hypothetical protein